MRFIYNITILFLFSSIYSCSTTNSIAIDKTEVPFYTIDSVFLVTPIYKITNNSFSFSLELQKIKDFNQYYFPSSEELRVIVKDGKGKTILNTSEGRAFFDAISPVEPQELKDKRGYAYTFTGINIFKDTDEIELYLILPVKPNEIFFKKRIKIIE